jgi:hypothetical protein
MGRNIATMDNKKKSTITNLMPYLYVESVHICRQSVVSNKQQVIRVDLGRLGGHWAGHIGQ